MSLKMYQTIFFSHYSLCNSSPATAAKHYGPGVNQCRRHTFFTISKGSKKYNLTLNTKFGYILKKVTPPPPQPNPAKQTTLCLWHVEHQKSFEIFFVQSVLSAVTKLGMAVWFEMTILCLRSYIWDVTVSFFLKCSDPLTSTSCCWPELMGPRMLGCPALLKLALWWTPRHQCWSTWGHLAFVELQDAIMVESGMLGGHYSLALNQRCEAASQVFGCERSQTWAWLHCICETLIDTSGSDLYLGWKYSAFNRLWVGLGVYVQLRTFIPLKDFI